MLNSCLENLKLNLIQTLDNDILTMIDDEEPIDIEINESSDFYKKVSINGSILNWRGFREQFKTTIGENNF